MMTLRNRVQLIGHPGSDPEVKELESGVKLAKFSLATSDHFRTANGERVDETEWHTIIAWGKLAEMVERFVRKGKEVGLEGRLQSRSYETKDGDKRYVTEVVLNELLLLGKRDD